MRTMEQMVVQCLKLYCQGYERIKQYKKAALLRLRVSEVQVFYERSLMALRGFNRNAQRGLSYKLLISLFLYNLEIRGVST